jgi:hypothetical protein
MVEIDGRLLLRVDACNSNCRSLIGTRAEFRAVAQIGFAIELGWRVRDSDSAQNYFVSVFATAIMALVALPHPA